MLPSSTYKMNVTGLCLSSLTGIYLTINSKLCNCLTDYYMSVVINSLKADTNTQKHASTNTDTYMHIQILGHAHTHVNTSDHLFCSLVLAKMLHVLLAIILLATNLDVVIKKS